MNKQAIKDCQNCMNMGCKYRFEDLSDADKYITELLKPLVLCYNGYISFHCPKYQPDSGV